jgi:hypothetical protein
MGFFVRVGFFLATGMFRDAHRRAMDNGGKDRPRLSQPVGCSSPLEQSSFSRVPFRSLRHCSPAQLYRRHHDMTTIWRPHPLIKHIKPVEEEVPDDVKVEPPADDDGTNGEDGTTPSEGKGAKRKRTPPTKGPCEHGVKHRSSCKVCSACPHGRRRSQCKECGGSQICEHGRERPYCKECGGSQICEHGRIRSQCKECGGGSICEHGRQRSQCKECGGSQICKHGRQRSQCKECGGGSICEHGRQRCRCKECGGGSICEHGRRRDRCKECKK